MCSAFFSPIVFSYDADNVFHRGPLGYVPLLVMVYYFIMLFVGNFVYAKSRSRAEKLILFLSAVTTMVVAVFDTISDKDGTAREYFAIVMLLFFVLLQNENMNLMIERDFLTGLYSRATTMQKIEACLSGEGKTGKHALLMLDMDNLKQVNDRLGHGYGDIALTEFASVMADFFEEKDICGRIGGDEFIVFVRDIDEDSFEQKVKEIIEKFSFTYQANDITVVTSASVGVAIYRGGNERKLSLNELYGAADEALYASKARGKHTYTFANAIGN